MKGWRKTMEDATISEVKGFANGESFFGVYDGHGGNANKHLSKPSSWGTQVINFVGSYRLTGFEVHRGYTS